MIELFPGFDLLPQPHYEVFLEGLTLLLIILLVGLLLVDNFTGVQLGWVGGRGGEVRGCEGTLSQQFIFVDDKVAPLDWLRLHLITNTTQNYRSKVSRIYKNIIKLYGPDQAHPQYLPPDSALNDNFNGCFYRDVTTKSTRTP